MNIDISLDKQELILTAETDFERNVLKFFNKEGLSRIKFGGDDTGDTFRISFERDDDG